MKIWQRRIIQECADRALYAAKNAGRDRVVGYEPGMDPHPKSSFINGKVEIPPTVKL